MGSRGEGWRQGSPESYGLRLGPTQIGGRSSGGVLLTRAHGVHQGNITPPEAQSTLSDREESLGRGTAVSCVLTNGVTREMQPCSAGVGGEQTLSLPCWGVGGCLWAFLELKLLLQPQASLPSKVKWGRILSTFPVGVGGAIT